MTNTFSSRILARAPWQLPYPIEDYGRATEEIRELVVEGNRTTQIFYLDHEGNICSGLKPTLVRSNGGVDHIEVNLSNEEFLPAKVPKTMLKHIIIMAPTAKFLHFVTTREAAEVPDALLDGIAWENVTLTADSKITLFALPMSVLGGYGKDFFEGSAGERPVLDLLKQEYGKDIRTRVETVMGAVDHYRAIMVILHKIEADAHLSLRDMFGGNAYDSLETLEDTQYPLTHITPLMRTTHPDSVTVRRPLLGPYKSVSAHPVL